MAENVPRCEMVKFDGMVAEPCTRAAAWIWRWSCPCVDLFCPEHDAAQLLSASFGETLYCSDHGNRVVYMVGREKL